MPSKNEIPYLKDYEHLRENSGSVIAIDAALLNIGIVVVHNGFIEHCVNLNADKLAETGKHKRNDLETFHFRVTVQGEAVAVVLRDIRKTLLYLGHDELPPVIIEAPLTREGKFFGGRNVRSAGSIMLAYGICAGVALTLGFPVIPIPVKSWLPAKEPDKSLAREMWKHLPVTPDMASLDENTSPHILDAACIIWWWLNPPIKG